MIKSPYRTYWDTYAEAYRKADGSWPGDEWGNEREWQSVFDRLFVPAGVEDWSSCVELGPGGGKYTRKILKASADVRVLAADISPAFQRCCKIRLMREGTAGRVIFVQLDTRPGTLLKSIEASGFTGTLDAFVSIDTMVHIDLQHLMIYLVTAAIALRPGGKLITTLANSTSDLGFEKLMQDAPGSFRSQGRPTAKFEWMSPDMVADLFTRIGFEVEVFDTSGRDMLVSAVRVEEPSERIAKVIG